MFTNLIYSTIFGAIQGLTEFLPVSSSGHLVILHQLFNLQVDGLIFDVALHFGTLLALLIYFRRKIYQLFGLLSNTRESEQEKQRFRLLSFIIIATIPAALVGLLFGDVIELYLRNITVVGWALIAGGVLLILADKYSAKQKDFYSLNLFETFLIGLAQALALIPGVSRSAITIIAGLGVKLQRRAAAEFSFLLAIPIISGAAVKKFFDIDFNSLSVSDAWVFIIGMLAAFVVGYLVIKYFIKFLERHSLGWFGWYRVMLGVGVLLWLMSS